MIMACHIRTVGEMDRLDTVFAGSAAELAAMQTTISADIDRVYVGDEFCMHRLPSPETLARVLKRASDLGLGVTLLTPPLTDDGLDLLGALLNALSEAPEGCEVIANDWGTARFVRENADALTVGVGRLLNKGFKDPRLPDPDGFRSVSENARTLLGTGTFDHPGFDDWLASLGIGRMERDLFPFADDRAFPDFPTSVYLPFGYVTTGRYCRTAALQSGMPQFAPLSSCGKPCRRVSFHHRNGNSRLPLIQSGNTVFYRYSDHMTAELFRKPNIRLVWQGGAI